MKYVLTVAKYLSFSKSSNALFISQSAISQSISRLEEELGYKLFVRSTKSVELTEKGKHSVELMRKIVGLSEELQTLSSMDDGSYSIRLAIVKGLYLPFMLDLLNDPQFGPILKFSEDESVKIVEEIKKGALDIGIVPIYEKNIHIIDSLRVLPLLDIQLYVFVSRDSHLAHLTSVSLDELAGENIAMYDGSYLKWLIHLIQRHVEGVQVLFYSTNQEFIREYVLNKNAISIDTISETIVNPYIDSDEVIAIPLQLNFPHHSFLGLVTKKENHKHYNFNKLVELVDTLIIKQIKQKRNCL